MPQAYFAGEKTLAHLSTFFSSQAEKDEKREVAQARFAHLMQRNAHLREKNRRLKARYIAAVDA